MKTVLKGILRNFKENFSEIFFKNLKRGATSTPTSDLVPENFNSILLIFGDQNFAERQKEKSLWWKMNPREFVLKAENLI